MSIKNEPSLTLLINSKKPVNRLNIKRIAVYAIRSQQIQIHSRSVDARDGPATTRSHVPDQRFRQKGCMTIRIRELVGLLDSRYLLNSISALKHVRFDFLDSLSTA